jgi:WD40 repeat protein
LEVYLNIDKIKDYLGHNSAIYCLAYDSESRVLYSAGGDGWIVKWYPLNDNPDGILAANTTTKIFSIALDETGRMLVAGDMDGHLYWLDTIENKIIKRSAFHKGSIMDLAYGKNNTLYSVSTDGYLCKWNTHDMVPEISVRISSQGLRCIKYDKEMGLLYIGASDNNIYVIENQTLQIINEINGAHENSVFSLELFGKGTLISGGRDAMCHIWDTATCTRKETISAHWFTVNKIISLPEISAFATASRDKTWRFWSSEDYKLLKNIDVQKGGHFNSVNSMVWIPEQKLILTAGDDRTIRLFKVT